jgi:Family of unknown function (DUF5985)
MRSAVLFLSGFLTMGYAIASLFFLRFFRQSRDALFGWFAAAFGLLAAQRVVLTLSAETSEAIYLLRLAAFAMIIIAIVGKNRASR